MLRGAAGMLDGFILTVVETGAVCFTSSMYWNGTCKEVLLCSTIKCPRLGDAPTTNTVSPLRRT